MVVRLVWADTYANLHVIKEVAPLFGDYTEDQRQDFYHKWKPIVTEAFKKKWAPVRTRTDSMFNELWLD